MPTSLCRPDAPGILPRANPFDGAEWVFEPKYDGFRALLLSTPQSVELDCRRSLGPEPARDLCQRIAGVLGGRDAILDGEVVALDRQGKPVLRDLLRGRGFLTFAAFDLLRLDGQDLTPLPLAERKHHLARLLPADTGPLYKVLTVDECGRALFEAIRKLDLEGIIAKRKRDPYSPDATWFAVANPVYARPEEPVDPFRGRGRLRRTEHPVESAPA